MNRDYIQTFIMAPNEINDKGANINHGFINDYLKQYEMIDP